MRVARFVIWVLVIQGLFNPVAAQSIKKDSAEIYQDWAKRGIIEMVYAYMKDYQDAVESITDLEKEGIHFYNDRFISNIEGELPDLDTVSNFLKNNSWGNIERTLFRSLNSNFENKAALDRSFFETTKPGSDVLITHIPNHTNKRINWDNKRDEVIVSYKEELSMLSKAEPEQQRTADIPVSPSVERQQETKVQVSQSESKVSKGNFYNSLFFLAGLLSGCWILFFISNRKISNILKKEKSEYLSELNKLEKSFPIKYIGLVYILQTHKAKYKQEKNELLEKNRLLQSREKEFETKWKSQDEQLEFKRQPSSIASTTVEVENFETPKTKEWEFKAPKKVKLFFSIPDSNGRFNNHNGDTVNDGKKFYCVEFEESANVGDLLFISTDKDKRAINQLETYLKPVCDIENYGNAESATHVALLSPGKVNLIDDSWVIDPDHKVEIKLI